MQFGEEPIQKEYWTMHTADERIPVEAIDFGTTTILKLC